MADNFCSVLFTKEIKKEKKQQGFDVIWSRFLLIWQIGRRELLRKAKKNQKVFRPPLFFDVNNDYTGHNQYVTL